MISKLYFCYYSQNQFHHNCGAHLSKRNVYENIYEFMCVIIIVMCRSDNRREKMTLRSCFPTLFSRKFAGNQLLKEVSYAYAYQLNLLHERLVPKGNKK